MQLTPLKLILVVLSSLSPLVAQGSADASPGGEKVELVQKILQANSFDKLAKQAETQTLARTLAVMAQNPLFPRGFLVELGKRMTDQMTALDLQAMVAPVYASHFTADDLRQILAFATSPVGQKLASSEVSIMTEVEPALVAWNRRTSQDATRQILTEHPEWARQMMENRQRQNAQALASGPPDGPGAGAFSPARDVTPPQIAVKGEPEYSEEARKAKISGSVTLSLLVGTDGAPHDIKVIKPLGSGLDEKAIEAVSKWRWKPASKNGVAVATHATVEVNFHLLNDSPK